MKTTFTLILLLTALGLIGCDHSTNTQVAPPGSELEIVNPKNDSVIDGVVSVSVDASAIDKVVKVEFYVNGQLSGVRSAPPWQFDWNTSTFSSNSFCTIHAKAFGMSSGYAVSQSVTVRIR